jgi:predicted transcriptional regulator
MEDLEEVGRLFYELSSESRLGILRKLQTKNLKMKEIAQSLDLTETEAFRQLQRLSEARLVQKQLDGTYRLTTYANLVLNTASPLDFISKFKEYFLEHDALSLPHEFRARLKELSGGKLNPVMIETFNKVAIMLKNAHERIDATIEVGSDLHLQIMMQRLEEGVRVRWLTQESFIEKSRSMLLAARKIPEIRVTSRILTHIYQTEKEAAVCFRNIDGTFDYITFFSKDSEFLNWSSDLWVHGWEKAKPWLP